MAHEKMPYAAELAEKVADYLVRNGPICYSHRDYCGVGLSFRDGEYLYDYVTDGGFYGGWYPSSPSPIRRFLSRAAFVAWLAAQSDDSMSGQEEPEEFLRNNKRITREPLEKHVAELEPGKPSGDSPRDG
jgi:hypothetical protein